MAAIPLLVRGHAQDAAFLFAQRSHEVEGQTFDETDLGRRDQRLEANIEGLAAAGRLGWEVAGEEAAAWGGAGETFALAALALGHHEAEEVEAAVARGLAAGRPGMRGLSGAAAWTPPDRLAEPARRWLAASDPRLRWLGVAALGHHRIDPGPRLDALLDDPEPGVRARAARLAGELGRRDALPRLRDRLRWPAEAPWPASAAARLGDPAGTAALLEFVEGWPDERLAPRALDLALVALGPEARGAVTRLMGEPATRVLALSRAGVPGDGTALPWLVDWMRDPATVAAAGQAFRDLVPLRADVSDLFISDATELGPGFEDAPEGPLPVADRVAAWLDAREPQVGRLTLRAVMLDALRAGVAQPDRPLPVWRARRSCPAWS